MAAKPFQNHDRINGSIADLIKFIRTTYYNNETKRKSLVPGMLREDTF